MAFIREVKRGYKRYYFLVETYREDGKVKQRQAYLGTEKPPRPWRGLPFISEAKEWMDRRVANRIPLSKKTGQLANSLQRRLEELDNQNNEHEYARVGKEC